MLALTEGEIHVWLTFYDAIVDERLHVAYRALLSDAERNQELRFHFAADRRRYLVTRAMVRTVLSRYAPVAPADWVFFTNPYGRPQIANAEARRLNLSFNISHTRSLIVLGVAQRRALGVDVENVRADQVSIEIADRFFAPDEIAALATVPPYQQQDRFFEYWTLKESYVKARGMGLSIPLDKFSFHYPHDRAVQIAIHPELGDDATRWQFWQFRPKPEYVVAICGERLDIQAPKLIVKRIIPAVIEEVLAPPLLRTSEWQPA